MKWRIVPIDYIDSLNRRALDAEARAAALLDRFLMSQGQLPIDPKTASEVAQVQTMMESVFNELGDNETTN